MYCSDIKLAQSLERDDVLETPKPRCSAVAVPLERKPSPWGGRGHRGGEVGAVAGSARPACCLRLPMPHRIALHAHLLRGVGAVEAQGHGPARQRMPGPPWGSRSGAGCRSQGRGESSCAQRCSTKHLPAGQGWGEVISGETY